MKKILSVMSGKKVILLCKKTICLALSLSLFINLATPAFAGLKQQIVEDDKILAELEDSLQEEYSKKKSQPNATEKALKDCLEKNSYSQCVNYVNILNNAFITTRDKIESGKDEKEKKYTPISKKEYKKQLKENTEREYKKNIESIEKQFNRENQIIDFQYQNAVFNTPEYTSLLIEKSDLSNWKKENENNLNSWKEEVLNNIDKYYDKYVEEFEKRAEEYKKDQEEAQNEAFKELTENVMKVYDKVGNDVKRNMIDILVMILSVETSKVKFFSSEQRSKIYKLLINTVYPNNSGSTHYNPCRFHTRARYDSEMKDYYEYMAAKSKKEEELRSTLSIRDQTAKQARPYEVMIENTLQAPITEPVDAAACEAAVSALNGLSFFKNWDMTTVMTFMLQNTKEPIAAQALLMGAKTLIDANRLDAFYALEIGLLEEEAKNSNEEDLKFKESIFFDNRFYRTPYQYSRYSQSDGGGDVWQDIIQMLSQKAAADNVLHNIMDSSVSFSGNKIYFNHGLPLIYGILLYNPRVIDTFIPEVAAYSYNQERYGSGYEYKGDPVKVLYFDDHVEMYVVQDGGSLFYLGDNATFNYISNKGYRTSGNSGEIRQQLYKNFQRHKNQHITDYKNYIAKTGMKASAVFAEAFYNADFVDLTVEEKLAMDKALEKKYPNLKKYSSTHKKKLENNRRNLDITTGVITIIDVALSFWCVADLYKVAKWGVRSIKGLRTLIKAGKAVATLSATRKVVFFRNLIAENKEVINVHRRIKKIKSINSRITNKFPAYRSGTQLTRMSRDGSRMLTVTKLDGTPVMLGQNTKKGQIIESEFSKIMMGTRDHLGVPAGMQGQRLAVQQYNKYLATPRKGDLWKKAAKVASTAKVSGPIHIFERNGVTPMSYKEIKFNKEGYFEIDGDLFKTFKATMEPKDITKYSSLLEGIIADLEKTLSLNKEKILYYKNNVSILSAEELLEHEKFNNLAKYLDMLKQKRYVTLRLRNQPFSVAEKWRLHKKGYEVVPLYNTDGNIVANVSLDMALKNSIGLSQTIKSGNRLLLKDNKIFIGGKPLEVNIGAPKEVITLMAKSGAKAEDMSFLTLIKKPSKMWPLFFNNMLSLSAGATSLNMSLSQAPFNNPNDPHYIPQPIIFGVSVGFPYAFSLLSPMAAPFVKRFGAANVQTTALVIGGGGMAYAAFNKYNGFASKKKDAFGKVIYDENGHTMTADEAPSYKPLVIASLASGVSSSLTRASLNAAIHRYQTTKASMTLSMLAKNVGSLSMVLLPWGAQAVWGKNNVDFSFSYPALGVLALLGIVAMKGFIPSSVAREFGYKIMPRKTTKLPRLRDFGDATKEIFKPFSLFASAKIMPYYLSYLSFGATESFVFFKTYNSFRRDSVENYMSDHTNSSKNFNKLLASVLVTLPSAGVRFFVKRKTTFSKGIFNSILLTTAGTIGLMLPSENFSNRTNIAIGILSGTLVGFGTANMYQYLQKTMIASVEDIAAKGVLPLARKFDGVTGLTTTAISFYSGAYIGSFIPYGYSLVSEKKLQAGATDFEANQSVLPLALGVYGLGTIPLLFTPMGRNLITKVSPYTPLFSIPAGVFGIRDLYQQSQSQQNSLMQPYTIKINNNLPAFKLGPQKQTLELMPYQDFKLKPFVPGTSENSEE